jgi:hypothetical protein
MLRKQVAGPQKPAATGHAVKGAAPGSKRAIGGAPMRGLASSVPAKAGHTAPPVKGR